VLILAAAVLLVLMLSGAVRIAKLRRRVDDLSASVAWLEGAQLARHNRAAFPGVRRRADIFACPQRFGAALNAPPSPI
jgi:outer membrane murein-binding lipoprotein Lpp